MNDRVLAMQELFGGLTRAHGQWFKGKARTLKKEVTAEDWRMHLDGEVGLGIVPIRDDDTCTWAAIDIDVDDIDHKKLAASVRDLNLPLVVFRSKSGGAHCILFLNEPTPAKVVREMLAVWAGELKYGQAEVFPKQDSLNGSIGNWLNLPYFDADKTNRYAVSPGGEPMNFEGFMAYARSVKAQTTLNSPKKRTKKNTKALPPCLQHYMELGTVPEGARNELMFNLAVFYKKALPETWADELMAANSRLLTPPLPAKEIAALTKSIEKKSYHYKCKVPGMSAHCNRTECMTLDFGIKDSQYCDFMVTGLIRVASEPPTWKVVINGMDVPMTTGQLYSFSQIRMRCFEVIGGMPPPMKDEEWRILLQRLTEEMQTEEVPYDASEVGRLYGVLNEFTRMAQGSRKREELIHGMPVVDTVVVEDVGTNKKRTTKAVLFRSADFISYAQRKKAIAFTPGAQLWQQFRSMGCGYTKLKISGRTVQVWYLPIGDDHEAVTQPGVVKFEGTEL